MSALSIQQERDAQELVKHRERLVWLEDDRPCWSDGEPVDAHTRHALIVQSRNYLATSPSQKEGTQ